MNKLFRKLNLNQISPNGILESLAEDLELPSVYLTFRYTSRRKVVFYSLNVKVDGKNKDLLGESGVKGSDGNQTFFIGQFKKGQEIEISYGILPLTKVPKAIALIGQMNPTKAYQVDPAIPGKTKLLERGTKWENTIKYKIQ